MIQTNNIGLNLVVGSELHISSLNANVHNSAVSGALWLSNGRTQT